jgi:GT2 family glycosyltransferase
MEPASQVGNTATSGAASVIVGTYNDRDILEASLAAFAVQSYHNFELVLADDGSSQDYAPVLEAWAPRIAHGIQHVSHEKRGFRKARILNRAIHVSRFDSLIFIDMDCLPHRDYVRNHFAHVAPGTGILGRRADIQRDVTPGPSTILEKGLGITPSRLVRLWMQGKARCIEHGAVLPQVFESFDRDLWGSNFSVHRSNMVAVNGFNEGCEGWGDEDLELGARLRFAGVRLRLLKTKVIQYHLLHDRLPHDNPRNAAILARTKATRMVRTQPGLAEIQAGDFSWKRYGAEWQRVTT